MPLQLTTPFDSGNFDTVDYEYVKIVEFTLNTSKKFIKIVCEYGNIVDDVWTHSDMSPTQIHIIADTLEDSHFSDLVSTTPPDTTSSIYDHAATKLYQWLIDQDVYSGTIV